MFNQGSIGNCTTCDKLQIQHIKARPMGSPLICCIFNLSRLVLCMYQYPSCLIMRHLVVCGKYEMWIDVILYTMQQYFRQTDIRHACGGFIYNNCFTICLLSCNTKTSGWHCQRWLTFSQPDSPRCTGTKSDLSETNWTWLDSSTPNPTYTWKIGEYSSWYMIQETHSCCSFTNLTNLSNICSKWKHPECPVFCPLIKKYHL